MVNHRCRKLFDSRSRPAAIADRTKTVNRPAGQDRKRRAADRLVRAQSVAALVLLATLLLAGPRGGQAASPVDFAHEIRPILSNNCFTCHGPDPATLEAGLRLDRRESAVGEADSGERPIVPGEPQQSQLVARITADDPLERMPPEETGKKLSEREIALLTQWIREGAPYAGHWSYVPPQRPPLPDLTPRLARLPEAESARLAAWPRNEIDRFILDRLLREGLSPAPEADRHALARRVALDLTGLPPAPEDVEGFVADSGPQAYERFVDRLLGEDAYGEHWAQMWLDLARYADSAGYADDPPRTIWAYRDWVIRALNENMPFDRFTIEQLAGDLLPDAGESQLVATAFHRNTLTNNEGGTNDEEFRNVAVVDRVNTTMAAWMGTTMACAQCHSHKYDPISQEDYFRLFAILNNTADSDARDESPLLHLLSDEQKAQLAAWAIERAALEWQLNGPQTELTQSLWLRLAELNRQLSEMQPVTSVPILRELPPDRRRQTFVQHRGNYLDLGDQVQPGLPSAFVPPSSGPPPDRLALARWLVDSSNPLTARVIANRYWEALFGRGIVASSEDFGSQGDLPTHPELLDWLATELVRLNWDRKAFLRQIVLSATYRQSSRIGEAGAAADPDNRLLSRGPRVRISAETVRDQALAIAGLLSRKLYGPPVHPPQPKSGLSAAFGGGIDWQTSEGPDRYRRAIYTTWRRSNPYPSMVTFDSPNREVCSVRRDRTNTPLQALVTLNDPVYVEAAQALARRMVAAAPTDRERAAGGFRLCLVRPPSQPELDQLLELHAEAHRHFELDPQAAVRMATEPLGPAAEGADLVDLAAWTVVANVLLNLDELLMKR